MATPRAAYHHGDLRGALLRAAAELIAEGGVDAFSLRAAAERAGVNHRAAYRHFDDKRALLAALAVQGWHDAIAACRRAMAAAPTAAAAQLAAFVRAMATFAVAHPGVFQVMSGARLNVDGAYPELEAVIADVMGLLGAQVARLRAGSGAIGPGDATIGSLAVWAALLGAAELVRNHRVRVRPTGMVELVEALVAPTLRGLQR